MPLPAVIKLIAPGSITLRLPMRIAVLDRAVEQISDGGEVDVRVRPHVHPLTGVEPRRAELVDENERADHCPLARRQGAAHLESAKVVGDRLNCLNYWALAHIPPRTLPGRAAISARIG